MRVNVIYKSEPRGKNSLFRLICVMICLFAGILIGVALSDATDDFPLLSSVEQLLELNGISSSSTLKQGSTVSSTGSSVSGSGVVVAGDQGLNTALIAQMSEGYCKDYLKICLEGANGTLAVKSSTKLPIQVPICVPVAENGQFYSLGDGKTVPLSDIPESKVVNYTNGLLFSWGGVQHAAGGQSAKGGAYQYCHGNENGETVLTPLKYKSKYSTSLTENGDHYNMGDCVASLIQYVDQLGAVGKYAFDDANDVADTTKLILLMNSHNRGGGGCQYAAYGLQYHTDGAGKSSVKEIDPSYVCKRFDEIYSDLTRDMSGVSSEAIFNIILESVQNKAMFWPMLFHSGWYIDQINFDQAKLHGWTKNAMDLWNLLYPEEQFSSTSQFESYVQNNYVKRACEVLTNGDVAKCDTLFGTRGGNYYSYSSTYHGNVFKPIKNTDNVYKSDNEYAAICLDDIAAHHILIAAACSDVVYAKMLVYAGVTVDPTNPSTYKNMVVKSGNSEWVSDSVSWLSNYGVKDTSNFGGARMAVLNAAYEILLDPPSKPEYSQGGNLKSDIPGEPRELYYSKPDLKNNPIKYFDCSSFVKSCYGYAKEYYGYDLDLARFPNTTGNYPGNLEQVSISELLPGDMIKPSSEHVVLFINHIGGNSYWTAEARSHNTDPECGFFSRTIGANSGCYRYPDLDKIKKRN